MDESETEPWYRQFWPWFLICLPASAVIASLYTVSLALRTTDSLVVTADTGMDVIAERHLAAERRARELGLSANLDIDSDTGAIRATLRSEHEAAWPSAIELQFSHPAFAERDSAVILSASMPDADGNPVWSGHVVDVPPGRWYVVLRNGDVWRLSGTWSGAAATLLVPAGRDADDTR